MKILTKFCREQEAFNYIFLKFFHNVITFRPEIKKMRGNSLYKTLELLDEKQHADLLRFLNSPFFNPQIEKSNRSTVLLFEYLRPRLPILSEESIVENEIYSFMFPDKTFVPGKVDKEMSALLKLVRIFIVVENCGWKDDANQSLILAKYYRSKKWTEKFVAEIGKIKLVQKNTTVRDEQYYFQEFLLNKEVYEYENLNNQRKGDLNLPNLFKSLDLYYILTKYKYTAQLCQQQKYVSIENLAPLSFDKQFRSSYTVTLEDIAPLINIYEKLLVLINEEEENLYDLFINLQALVSTNEALIPLEEMQELQAYLRNFCTSRHNMGDTKFLQILFELYKDHLEKGYLLVEDKIIASAVLNIVSVGLRVKQYDWVKQFLADFEGKISGTQFPDEVYNLNYANYLFHIAEYDKAWKFLDWNYEDIYFKLASKRIEMKILFEQNEIEMLDSKVNAFKVYIFRADKKLIAANIKEMNNAFVNYLSQIISPNTLHNHDRILKIRQKIIAQNTVAEREWLLEKTEELLQKKNP